MKTKLNLDQVRVASPCHARWEDMAGDNRARFCGQCQKNVFNFSAMTRVEVETLLREKEGKLCGRFYQRPDGRMLTADCPSGQRRKRNRLARFGGAIFALALFFLNGCAHRQNRRTMGIIALPPETMGKISAQHLQPEPQPLMGDVMVLPPPETKTSAPTEK